MAPLKYSIVGEQARYSALLPGPVVIVFRNCAGLFTSSTLFPENVLLPLFSRLRFCRGYFFGDASANFPRAINSSRVDAFAVSVGTSRAKFLPHFFLCFWKRVFLPFVPDLLLPPRSGRYCSTWNTKCKMGTFLFFYCSHSSFLENQEKLRNSSLSLERSEKIRKSLRVTGITWFFFI